MGLLGVHDAGRIRTYDKPFSQKVALSAELQRHASRNLDVRDRKNSSAEIYVDIAKVLNIFHLS